MRNVHAFLVLLLTLSQIALEMRRTVLVCFELPHSLISKHI